ncbi:MAG TPA: hypothetical protein VF165_11325 [Nocardioidaceae bacterium]
MMRGLARTQQEIGEALADAGAPELLKSAWSDLAGEDQRAVMKELVLRFQAHGLQPRYAALQEFAQLIANRDARLPAMLETDV